MNPGCERECDPGDPGRRLVPRALCDPARAANARRVSTRPERLHRLARRRAGRGDEGRARRLRREAARGRPRRDDRRAPRRRAAVVLPSPDAPRRARGQPRRRARAATPPPSLRDRALVELLYGAGLRVSEAVGLERGAVDLENRLVRALGKGSKERIVPIGREAADALRRYLAHGRPFLDKRRRPELFLNAQGGALTR